MSSILCVRMNRKRYLIFATFAIQIFPVSLLLGEIFLRATIMLRIQTHGFFRIHLKFPNLKRIQGTWNISVLLRVSNLIDIETYSMLNRFENRLLIISFS